MEKHKNRKIIISGATSGIGRAAAILFARDGAEVMALGRRTERLKELESLQLNGRIKGVELDVANIKAIENFAIQHLDFLQNADVLINNAGLALGRDKLSDSALAEVETMLQTNVMGLLALTRVVVPHMIKNKSGHIVNLGSIAGLSAYPGGTVYCATKAAVHMITDTLRMDLGGTGVRVTTIAPGRVATEFSEVRFRGDKESAKKVYEGFRPLTSENVAESIAWCVGLPEHINIQELVIMPTDQPSVSTMAPLLS